MSLRDELVNEVADYDRKRPHIGPQASTIGPQASTPAHVPLLNPGVFIPTQQAGTPAVLMGLPTAPTRNQPTPNSYLDCKLSSPPRRLPCLAQGSFDRPSLADSR